LIGRRGSLILGNGIYGYSGQNNDSSSLSSYTFNERHVTSMIMNNANVTLSHNGVISTGSIDAAVANLGTSGTFIGQKVNNVEYMFGNIYELLVYDSALSDSDRTKMEAYLSSKWLAPLAGETPFSSALSLWLDASDSSTLFSNIACSTAVSNGSAVGCWKDKSPKGNDVLQNTGALQPVYNTNVVNSRSAITFTSDKLIGINTSTFDVGTGDISWFVVTQPDEANASAISRVFGNLLNTGNFSGFAAFFNAAEQPRALYRTSSNNILTSNVSRSGQWTIVSSIRRNSVASVYVDGLLATTVANTDDVSGDGISIGSESTAGTQYYLGKTAEILIYQLGLPDSERKKIESYLKDKWMGSSNVLPSTVSGLTLWLDADDSATINNGSTANGASITQWTNKAANANVPSVTASGNATPVYRTLVTNGRSAIQFDGTNHTLSRAAVLRSDLFEANSATLFLVHQDTNAAGKVSSNFQWSPASGKRVNVHLSDGTPRVDFGTCCTEGVSRVASSSLGVDTMWSMYTMIRYTNSTGQIYKNGSAIASGSMTETLDTSAANLSIGLAGGTNSIQGYVGEVLAYRLALSDTNRVTIENYLTNKWGINPSLSGSFTNPETPNSLVLWLDAQDASTINNGASLSDFTTLTEWKDKSISADRAIRFRTTGDSGVRYRSSALNGKPTFFFDAIPLQLENSINRNIDNAGTWFTVMATDPDYTTQYGGLLSKQASDGTNFILLLGLAGNNGQQFCSGNAPLTCASASNGNTGFTGGQPYVLTYRYKAGNQGKADFFKNGGYQGSFKNVSVNAANSVPNTGGVTKIILGARGVDDQGGYTDGFRGNISEVLMYNYFVNDVERQGIENYLMSKWGMLNIPLTVSNLSLWLDASDASTINGGANLTSGTAISAVADKSPNALNMTSSGGYIRYANAASELLNNKPVLKLTSSGGTGVGLASGAVPFSRGVSAREMTAFAVMQKQQGGGIGSLFWWDSTERFNIHLNESGLNFDFGACCVVGTRRSRFRCPVRGPR
jgi:hypothetical protein